MQYAELQCRTNYSFLRGASFPHELVERAAQLELSALAIVDRNGVYGIPKAYEESKKHPSLKLIVGAELTLGMGNDAASGSQRFHLNCLARNRAGYGLLCRLLTKSHEGRAKDDAELGWLAFRELFEGASEEARKGLIAYGTEGPEFIFKEYRELFEDRFYIPLIRALDGGDEKRQQQALIRAKALGSKIIAVNDVHYHAPERRKLQDVVTSIREGKPLARGGFEYFPNGERYLKSPQQMAELFRELPEALETTLEVTQSCTFSPAELRYRYPSEWIPQGETAHGYLERLVEEGAKLRYPEGVPADVRRQLQHEFKLVRELHFSDYFLTIWEIVDFARSRGILCQGRGSAANSVICYCLGITAIDPVRMKLLFERFISAERGEPPDIDVDFENARREEVIQHIYEKYGRDRAAMVSAVITYRSRSAKGEIGKALGSEDHPQLSELMEEIRGFPRHLSIHSGGFTLSADPIIETVPVEPARMEGRTIVQWDKEDLAIIGLLKVDILALGMLTALSKVFKMIEHEKKLSIAAIPANDPRTYEMLRRADTVGTFQVESRAQMNMLHRLQPANFYDLVVQVAIVRPGPIVGKMVHPYLKRKRGLEPIIYPDPRLEPILGRTLGVPLFQEQVMKIAIVLAGFTPGEADELRRAIGAWRSSGQIEKMGQKLMAGLLRAGLPQEFVDRVFLQIRGFSEYGFPESHAASFAMIAYASSYLKCHYPAEFLCALLNSQPMGFYSAHTLVEDAKRHGVTVLPLSLNNSSLESKLELFGSKNAVRLGFDQVFGMSSENARAIFEEQKREPFLSLENFYYRTNLSLRLLFTLATAGTFESFGIDRREALWRIMALYQGKVGQQLSLGFCASAGPQLPEMSLWGKIQAEYQALGLSVSGHPVSVLRTEQRNQGLQTSAVKQLQHGAIVKVDGMVIARQRPHTANGTVFATLEDETGFVDLLLKSDFYEKNRDTFVSEPFLKIEGRVQRDRGAVLVVVDKVMPLISEEIRFSSRDFH